MANDITLEIEESYTIRGRGLMLVPKDFLFVTPKGVPKPFSNQVVLVKPDGTCEDVECQFLIEHSSLASKHGGRYDRYSLVLLLPEKPETNLPVGSQIRVSESVLSLMKNLVERLA